MSQQRPEPSSHSSGSVDSVLAVASDGSSSSSCDVEGEVEEDLGSSAPRSSSVAVLLAVAVAELVSLDDLEPGCASSGSSSSSPSSGTQRLS